MKLIQVVSGLSVGDGVSNVVKTFDKLFQQNGYSTKTITGGLNSRIIAEIESEDDAIVFYHAALTIDPMITILKCRKVMVFHNITFPYFFDGFDERLKIRAAHGWYDVSHIADYFECAIVFSGFSRRCLVENGWGNNRIYEVPILIRFDKLKGEINTDLLKRYKGNGTNLLFTGRICPNKKQEDIIYAFAEYKKRYCNEAKLFLVGGVTVEKYNAYLRDLISKLCLDDSVIMSGFVPFSDYLAYYELADVYICMSEHEGFCIPLVEAMFFQKPIIAYDDNAISDTMRGCEGLVNTKCPSAIAREIDKIVSDERKKNEIVSHQNDRLKQLLPETLEADYEKIVFDIVTNDQIVIKYKNKKVLNNAMWNVSLRDVGLEDGQKIVICGAGRVGKRVYHEIKDEMPEIDLTVCDSSPEKVDGEMEVGKLLDTAKRNKDALYIISVQNKLSAREIFESLLQKDIKAKNIFFYDSAIRDLF